MAAKGDLGTKLFSYTTRRRGGTTMRNSLHRASLGIAVVWAIPALAVEPLEPSAAKFIVHFLQTENHGDGMQTCLP
jgi:hypothetical protein